MEQEVYVDLYFLINACMDLLSLMITAALSHRAVRRLRAVIAACFGGGYSVWSLLFLPDGMIGLAVDVAAAMLICTLCFFQKKTPMRRMIKLLLLYLLVSVLLGGVMTVLYSLLNRLPLPLELLEGDGLSVWIFSLLAAVAGFATAKGGRILGLHAGTKTVTLEVSLFGKQATVTALVDSGNLLRDPITGKGVIVIRKEAVSQMLPHALIAALAKGPEDWLRAAKGLRLIPAKSISDTALLPALSPDRLTVITKKERYDADYLIAIAALGENAQGFDAIISLH